MIFNKFRPIFFCNRIKALSLQLLALSLFSCNKSANINANKSFVGLTHVAYGLGPISLTLDGKLLFANPLAFGLTTGLDGNPYDTTVSRISDMNIFLAQDTTMSIHGNAAFQQGYHYSIFFYDTLDHNSVTLIILQDNPPVYYDTVTSFRFMNFSPGSNIGLKLIYKNDYYINDTFLVSVRDTTIIGPSQFVGYNPNPGFYTFSWTAHNGINQVFAFWDSANPTIDSLNPALDSTNFMRLDSLQFDSTKSYNVYLQGFLDSPNSQQNKLQIKSVRVN
jgi:hypothetical protein